MIKEHETLVRFLRDCTDSYLGGLAADLLLLGRRGALEETCMLRWLGREYPGVRFETLEHFVEWAVLRRFVEENAPSRLEKGL